MEFLGWVILIASLVLGWHTWRHREIPNRRLLGLGAAVALLLGGYLALSSRWALANMKGVDLSHSGSWVVAGPADAIRWEANSAGRWRRLTARLTVDSDSYAAIPVDWQGDAFEAEWDMVLTQLDVRPASDERASVCIGLTDGAAANIDDPDHVSGSAIEACFSDDVRLRASDQDRLLKTHSSTELSLSATSSRTFTPSAPVRLELDTPYHCRLAYDGPTSTATLTVTRGGRVIVSRRLEDLRDFTSSVAWFGVTVRGYKRYNKQLADKDKSYTKPTAEVVIENLRYRQP